MSDEDLKKIFADEYCPLCGWAHSAGHAEICPRHPNALVHLPRPTYNVLDEIAKAARRDLRERAAIAAMQGLCAALDYCKGYVLNESEIASDAVSLADHLIAELKKTPGQDP